jgi:uncharacterized protein YndB with AHSA1/START domain
MRDAGPLPEFPPLRKSVRVKALPDAAFHRFTAQMASWWPLRSHSVGQQDAETVVMEGRPGGRILERIRGGRECVWGTVTAWEPPRRVAFTWHPGDDPARAQDIEVLFTGEGDHTRVDLEHRGFERLGAGARKAYRGYPIGWAYVLGVYAGKRGPFMLVITGLTAAMMGLMRARARFSPKRKSA